MTRTTALVACLCLMTAARPAAAQCATPSPWLPTLTPMCPDGPALAQPLNANFAALLDVLQQKVGPVGAAPRLVAPQLLGPVSVDGGVAVGGAVSVTGPLVVSGTTTANGPLVVNDTLTVKALTTRLLSVQPTSTASYGPGDTTTDLQLTFVTDVPVTADLSYALTLQVATNLLTTARLLLDGAELTPARSASEDRLARHTGRALTVLSPGTHTVTVRLITATTATCDPTNSTHVRALTVLLLGQ